MSDVPKTWKESPREDEENASDGDSAPTRVHHEVWKSCKATILFLLEKELIRTDRFKLKVKEKKKSKSNIRKEGRCNELLAC